MISGRVFVLPGVMARLASAFNAKDVARYAVEGTPHGRAEITQQRMRPTKTRFGAYAPVLCQRCWL